MTKSIANTIDARELALYAVNSATLYRQRALPVIANLAKKKAAGAYDVTLAPRFWRHLADDAARAYVAEFYGPKPPNAFGDFTVATRVAAAIEIAEHYAEHLEERAAKLQAEAANRREWSMGTIARANTDGGHNFFSPGTKRYFGDAPSYFRPVYIGPKIYFDRVRAANHAPAGYPVDELHEFNPADGSIGLPIRGADRQNILTGE